MKKSFLGMAAIVPFLALTACSDDSSSPADTGAPSSSSQVLGNNGLPADIPTIPGDNIPGIPGGDNQEIPGGVNTPAIPGTTVSSSSVGGGVVVVPEDENIADKPISEDDKKSDGTESVSSQAFDIKGVTEMGPFRSGATVTVSSVDAKTMAATPGAASVKTSDKLGSYSAKGSLTSAIASIDVKGSYLNFTDETEQNSTFGVKVLTDLRNRKKVNVNVLTRLEYDRVMNLVVGSGMSFTAAKVRAEQEIRAALGMRQDTTLFEDISLYDLNSNGAGLLAVTASILNERNGELVDAILEDMAADLATDGKWDNDAIKAVIADAAYYMDIGYPTSVLADNNNNADLKYFREEVERMWAAAYNLGTCGPNNQKQIKPNSNPASNQPEKMFVCVDSMWAEASPAMVADIAATALFGACTEANAGTMKQNAEGGYFLCTRGVWKVADDGDMKNMEIGQTIGACNSANKLKVVNYQSGNYMCISGVWTELTSTPVDYSKGRAMNQKLGAGINFGNSWEAPSADDGGWSNPIQDGDFAAVKSKGFNSVRIPVRWYTGMSSKLSGVKADVTTAINAGLVVIINYHHYDPMYQAAKNGQLDGKLNEFANEWKQIAQAFDSFADDKLVFEIFNEPHDMTQDQVNKIMTTGYNAIRSVSKGKTIMFESNGYSKFAMIPKLDLPKDGNIIVSGHYYEPYTFTHQGHGYDCSGSAGAGLASIAGHFESYATSIALAFPDSKQGSVPMNVGEFGVANKGGCNAVSDANREKWTDAIIEQAEKYDMSWHYWCFKNCGGFEASNGGSWYGNMLNVFQKYMK